MNDKLTVIDGGKTELAPRPHHGLVRAVYDTVEACGGANITQIKKYLPAAIDNIGQVMKKKRLQSALYNAVYSGYLIHDDGRKYWHIAPIDYYIARQEHLKEIEAKHQNKVKVRGAREPYDMEDTTDLYYTIRINKVMLHRIWMVIGVAAVFAGGAIAGRLI